MLKCWKLHNFKSFKSPPVLPLSKINILAGSNSSGKSTIIQSILLLKQSLQYGAPDKGMALNGPLLRMGEFNDIKNFDADDANIRIEFEIEPENQTEFSEWGHHFIAPFLTSALSEVAAINVATELGQKFNQEQSDGNVKSKLILNRADISAVYNDAEVKRPQSLSLTKAENEGRVSAFQEYHAVLDDESFEQLGTSRPSLKIFGASTRHFLPDQILLKFDAAAQKTAELTTYLCSGSTSLLTRSRLGEEIIPQGVIKLVNSWLASLKTHQIETTGQITANELRHKVAPLLHGSTSLGLSRLLTIDAKKHANQTAFRALISDALAAEMQPNFTFDVDMPKVLRAGSEYIREFFLHGIRYLGPLRDAPRPVYPLEALENRTDVGYRGEHTAAVFELNSHSAVTCHLPPNDDFTTDYLTYANTTSTSLHDAAIKWLGYLGVADEVKATDSGVFGNRLQVAHGDTDHWHDLTNVGVGVSQVLPLVITALLAPPGSLLIFEQPELHLHPRVQARLADFFIALALDGKQMILETHSEYLIDRLRLRIALSDNDDMRQMVNILFTEKHGKQSKITPIEVSEYGAISNWPKDFFDQSQKDVARLLKAAAGKRNKRAKINE